MDDLHNDDLHNRDKFIHELKINSVNKIYPLCTKEWDEFFRIKYDGYDENCICGKAIKEVITIRNRLNNNRLIVGNVCINQFAKDIVSYKCCYCGEKIRKPNKKEYGFCAVCKKDRIVKRGKYSGKTLLWIMRNDKQYVSWLGTVPSERVLWAFPLLSFNDRMEKNFWSLADCYEPEEKEEENEKEDAEGWKGE